VTSKLLARYEISKPLVRCDEKSEEKAGKQAIEMLEEGKKIALVSDAGTPGISDPGARLVRRVRHTASVSDARIEAIPGPSALTAALSIAGMGESEFLFKGFLPHKKGRQTALKEVLNSKVPVVLYESPHRVVKLLHELGEREVSVGRELTKMHEEWLHGRAVDNSNDLERRRAVRGEFVIIVHSG
jgi:16S rRNA (cytidine1402-2'-O)-methyltransferase